MRKTEYQYYIELERLAEENEKLREQVAELEAEIASLNHYIEKLEQGDALP